jgi:hypothetical protein
LEIDGSAPCVARPARASIPTDDKVFGANRRTVAIKANPHDLETGLY